MNKKVLITALLALIALVGYAQEIGMAKPSAEDYIKLLNHQGYHVFALDLSNLEKDKYVMSPVVQVYYKRKLEPLQPQL